MNHPTPVPTPLREDHRWLDRAAEVEAWPETDRQETWRRIAGTPPRRGSRWVPVAVAGAAVVLVGLGLRFRAPAPPRSPSPLALAEKPRSGRGQGQAAPRTVDLGSLGTLDPAPAAVYALESPHTLRLAAGRVCASIRHHDGQPFLVLAPSVRVVDVGTRFCVEVVGGRSTVEVTEGEVRVEGEHGRGVRVAAGERIDSGDARLAPRVAPVPVPAAAPPPRECGALQALDAREQCLARASTGDDLAAQNALYDLALLARDQRHDGAAALTLFQAYLHRFPQGPLAPEASLGTLRQLAAQGSPAEAAAEARRYLSAYPGEAKAPEVCLVLGNLEREQLGQPEAAREAYEEMLRSQAAPELQGEALFGLGLAELQLGRRAEAEVALRRYLVEHPAGAHAADAARLLGR